MKEITTHAQAYKASRTLTYEEFISRNERNYPVFSNFFFKFNGGYEDKLKDFPHEYSDLYTMLCSHYTVVAQELSRLKNEGRVDEFIGYYEAFRVVFPALYRAYKILKEEYGFTHPDLIA